MEEGKKNIIGDTLASFGEHTPLIIEEDTTRNKLRQQKFIFDRQKPPHTSHKVCGGSNALAAY
jgi:hypothetical protein